MGSQLAVDKEPSSLDSIVSFPKNLLPDNEIFMSNSNFQHLNLWSLSEEKDYKTSRREEGNQFSNKPIDLLNGEIFTNNIQPNNQKKVEEEGDEFMCVDEDADKDIRPQDNLQTTELKLVNTLMKDFSVNENLSQKKKEEDLKKEEEMKKKQEEIEQHKKKEEEAKPKKNLDDLFDLLGKMEKLGSLNQLVVKFLMEQILYKSDSVNLYSGLFNTQHSR